MCWLKRNAFLFHVNMFCYTMLVSYQCLLCYFPFQAFTYSFDWVFFHFNMLSFLLFFISTCFRFSSFFSHKYILLVLFFFIFICTFLLSYLYFFMIFFILICFCLSSSFFPSSRDLFHLNMIFTSCMLTSTGFYFAWRVMSFIDL